MIFESEHAKYLYEGAIESGAVHLQGDEESPIGGFASITLVEDFRGEEAKAIRHYGTRFVILIVKGEAVKVLAFETEVQRNDRLDELQRAFGVANAGLTNEEVLAAIFGYQSTAEAAADLDGYGHGWTEEAQRTTAHQVTQFLIDNVEHVGVYLETVKEEWPHAGAQFFRSRNGELGFASDAAGETVNALLAASQGFGPQRVALNEEDEIDIELSQPGTGSRE